MITRAATVLALMLAGASASAAPPSASPPARSAAPMYEIVDLGGFGGSYASANAINDVGQIVGAAEGLHGPEPFLWDGGRLTHLGHLAAENRGGSANAISANGLIAGGSLARYPPGGWSDHPFLWSRATGMRDLLPATSLSSGTAIGINSAGLVAGNVGRYGAFLWSSKSGMKYLSAPDSAPGFVNTLNGFSETGWVCGSQVTTAGISAAWAYDSAAKRYKHLPGLGGISTVAYAVNALGDAVGLSLKPNLQMRPVLWTQEGDLVDLGFLQIPGFTQGEAHAINDHRWIVGWDPYDGDGRFPIGWLWVEGDKYELIGRIADPVQRSAWTQLTPLAINNHGQIVGQGTRSGGEGGAFLMTPLP